MHLSNQTLWKRQSWEKAVTEILKLSGHMISEHKRIVPQRKSHQKMRSLLLENLAFLYGGCVMCGFFSKTERNISFFKAFQCSRDEYWLLEFDETYFFTPFVLQGRRMHMCSCVRVSDRHTQVLESPGHAGVFWAPDGSQSAHEACLRHARWC